LVKTLESWPKIRNLVKKKQKFRKKLPISSKLRNFVKQQKIKINIFAKTNFLLEKSNISQKTLCQNNFFLIFYKKMLFPKFVGFSKVFFCKFKNILTCRNSLFFSSIRNRFELERTFYFLSNLEKSKKGGLGCPPLLLSYKNIPKILS